MAETDPVRIVVEIVDQFSDEINELRAQLEELDLKDIDADFDIEDGGDIESIRAQMQALEDDVRNNVEFTSSGFASTMTQKQILG